MTAHPDALPVLAEAVKTVICEVGLNTAADAEYVARQLDVAGFDIVPRPPVACYPLLPVADCPACRRPVRLRKDGVTRQHRAPDGRLCVQRRVRAAPTTFARWLYLHRTRRDVFTNPITQLAQVEFGGPRMCGDRGPADVAWTTADELHTAMHTRTYSRPECDWLCAQIALASDAFAALAADAQHLASRLAARSETR